MSDEYFNQKNTGFWGALAAFFWLLNSYLRFRSKKVLVPLSEPIIKGENMENVAPVGIKETKELLDGLNAVSLEIISLAKDGIQIKDAAQLVEDLILKPEFKAKLSAAIQGVGMIPSEIKNMDLAEGVELAQFEYDGVKNIIAALK